MNYFIEKEKCNKCGTCYTKCPFKSISKNDEDYKIDSKKCQKCLICIVNCKNEAISLKK